MRHIVEKLKRGLKKPPRVIAQRLYTEVRAHLDRFILQRQWLHFNAHKLLKKTYVNNLNDLWERLSRVPFLAVNEPFDDNLLSTENKVEIFTKASHALNHQVDLLGSGMLNLGQNIVWSKDYKTGHTWKNAYFRDIDYNLKGQPCDVKFPWELSRLQWLIPVGQAFLLTGDEKYAVFAKNILLHWIDNNPPGKTVNWSCTMEVAMRIMVWTWFFHIFKSSNAWKENAFREKFLCALYLHAVFTQRYIEISDVNGNHLTADAAALVFAGCFWQDTPEAAKWLSHGWALLEKEILLQVTIDGVDFEGSVPYHRLVLELFFLAARYRLSQGLTISLAYQDRLLKMAEYTAAYTRHDGTIPLLGDADDARVLPFGEQNINDHRYLVGWVGCQFEQSTLLKLFSGSHSEVFWLMGHEASKKLAINSSATVNIRSKLLKESGMVILRRNQDHVFIDCAPVGLANKGGHGHNDCLSVSAMLEGVELLTDCGAYVYTADYQQRNLFRSTAFHNTPRVDKEEINRFIHPDYLWNLHADAIPSVTHFSEDTQGAYFQGEHTGYLRLDDPVLVQRRVVLDHQHHVLTIEDRLQGQHSHFVEIPLHLHPDVKPQKQGDNQILLNTPKGIFILQWSGTVKWHMSILSVEMSPSYGEKQKIDKICWQYDGPLPLKLKIMLGRNII